jgi:transcriptional regulator with XRE-family HTH domain
VITGIQIRQARAALRWTTRELADRSNTSASTITRAESAAGVPSVNARALLRIKAALEDGGAEFMPDGSVRVRP